MSIDRIPFKYISVFKVVLFSCLSFGFYTPFWYFNRSRELLKSLNRAIPAFIYILALLLLASSVTALFVDDTQYFFLIDGSLELLWSLWLLSGLKQNCGVALGSHGILRSIHIFLFGTYYLQYKINQAHGSSEEVKIVADGKWFKRIVLPAYAVILVVALLRLTIINWYYVPVETMSPTIIPGDRVLSYRVAYSKINDIKKGDIIVFQSPLEPEMDLIARVTGLPGDRIDSAQTTDFEVPAGHIFVQGDNAEKTSGSNLYGPIPFESVKGKALWLLWNLHPLTNQRDKRFFKELK